MIVEPTTNPVSLHYNIYFGIDLIGEWYKIYLLPASGLVVLIINWIISLILHNKSKVLSYFTLSLTLFLQLCIGIATYLILRQSL